MQRSIHLDPLDFDVHCVAVEVAKFRVLFTSYRKGACEALNEFDPTVKCLTGLQQHAFTFLKMDALSRIEPTTLILVFEETDQARYEEIVFAAIY